MPYNNSYEDGDEDHQSSDHQRNRPAHSEGSAPAQTAAAVAPQDESALLKGGVDTYFSDEKILIPESERVSKQ